MATPDRQPHAVPTTRLTVPALRQESIHRKRLFWGLEAAIRQPLTVIVAPAGYGKTTAVVQWLERSEIEHAWLSLDGHDNDPRRFAAHLIAAVDRAMPGELEAAERALQGGSDLGDTVVPLLVEALVDRDAERLAIVLDDYHVISDARCHELSRALVDSLPAGVSVVVISRTEPPLRLARRRAAGTLGEIGPEELRFDVPEIARLLNGSLGLAFDSAQIEQIDARVHGWAAGLTLIATALAGRDDRAGFLEALARSRTELDAYLIEEVLETARPELRTFLCRTSIVRRLSAPLCEALLRDPNARRLFDEVRRENLFVTALATDDTWICYHDVFADTLRRELERREPEAVGELHRRASEWFERAAMPEEAIEHALAAGDGPRAASLLAESWIALVTERRFATLRLILDRLPEDRGDLGPLCEAIDLVCMTYEGVDQRLTCERAARLAEQHGDSPRVRLVLDGLLVSPFYGDVGRAVEIGREAWARYADDPDTQLLFASLFALVLWFAGEYNEVRELLEPRVRLAQPTVFKVFTLATLSRTAADEGDAELAERLAREAMAEVEAVGGETATEFTSVPIVLADALRLRGELEEARHHLDRGLEGEARLPGSVGHAVALVYDAELALAEHDRARARSSASHAREIIDRYPDVGTFEARLARIEDALGESHVANPLLGTEPTRSELRILQLLDSELTLAEIARELYVSQHTVKSHVRRLYRRLGAGTREAAVAVARERELLDDA
jgi:LuxR family transcriptional regulator, maltose regulon positive regulatory protein